MSERVTIEVLVAEADGYYRAQVIVHTVKDVPSLYGPARVELASVALEPEHSYTRNGAICHALTAAAVAFQRGEIPS